MSPILFALEYNPAWHYLFGILLTLAASFLILLVLIQRGRGGGLAGAFGGMGGQSAFGTKAGDLFTKVTMGAASVWILLCVLSVLVLSPPPATAPTGLSAPGTTEGTPAGTTEGTPAGTAPAGTGESVPSNTTTP